MDSNKAQEQIGSSEDEDQDFQGYMDRTGVIGLEDGILEPDNQGYIKGEEDDQIVGLEEDMLEEDEEGILFPESPLDGERSDEQSWKEQFNFTQMSEERRNQDFIAIPHTGISLDDLSFVDQPSMSITLPSALGRRPPSRDQQLDMTEDEVDQGSSLGAWDGDEDENWNMQQLDSFYHGIENRSFKDYDQTSGGEDQWDNLPESPDEEYSIPGNQGGEVAKESISPSSPPLPSTWNPRLFDMLSISHGIEEETLPESSRTESGDGSAAIHSEAHEKVSRVTQVSNQTKVLETKSPLSPSSNRKIQHNTQHTSQRKSKNPTISQYGRGQLNYPLPDFSKVGPRVRFPRDEQSYRPPQPRRPENQNQDAPALFKSPAEIVREVLLSSTDKPLQEPAIPPSVPKEFKTPQQATELVHQLQEDYHKLLTKYAEAENTIDRLRLGAKVHLYSDPAKPSHSVQMGTVMQGSKIMEFTIPHAQVASLSSVKEDNVIAKQDAGSSSAPLNNSVTPSDGTTLPATTSGSSFLQRPEDTASILRSHLETLHREVDLFEGLMQGGNLTPGDQQQAVRELRGSLDVLERRYLQAQEQYRQEHRQTGHPSQEMDPQRELEEAIFQLGVQLDELQERVDHPVMSNSSTDLTHTTHKLDNASVPSAVVPVPATQTPYPQVTSPGPPGLPGTGTGTSDKEDPAEYLPQPIFHKHMQLERDYGTLLSTYSSFKSLPDALGVEQDEWPQQLPQIAQPHDHQERSTGQGFMSHVSKLQDHAHATKPPGPISSVSTQNHENHVPDVSSQDFHLQTKVKGHSPRASQQHNSRSAIPQSFQPAGSPTDDKHASSSASGINRPVTSSPKERRRASSVSSRHSNAPDDGKSSVRRMPHGSKRFPQRVSLSSSLPKLKEQSPRTPTIELSVSEESLQESPSHKSSVSSKNVSPSDYKETLRTPKGKIAQRRIFSPETDSGFLGSESGRSFMLQKHPLSLNREVPVEAQDSSNAAVKNKRQFSKNGNGNFPGTSKVLRDNTKQTNAWTGPSEASSPSLGPKSLTDSESGEKSHTDESDSERERSNEVIDDLYSGASLLPSPTAEPSQPLRDIMESRQARDQAIHDLQKEVTQLRHHLDNSLNRSPARGKQWKPVNVHKQRDGEDPHFSPGLGKPIYRHKAPVKDSRAEHQWRNSVSHDHDPSQQGIQEGKGVQGPYTGTRYQLSDPLPTQTTEHDNVSHCPRCQESERRKHVTIKTSKDDESLPPTHPACPYCKSKNGSDNAPRTGIINGENKHHRRHQHYQHWYMSHPPPVNYLPSPLVPYSPPVIYSTPPGIYVPVGYNVADMRSSFSVAPFPNSDILELDDLSYPLSRALEAAKKLKTTSKRMCQSLTTELSMQRSVRTSCLF
ncbi:microtubule organization protein AKNA isoform X2 [Pyxicephalus adspersus]|uniref:AKNA domain-containing protein n=1 Tax=Pyxicephalus adspersus TaxID=30357 RepID=A0AAV2ZXK0_PYXAD|nr:TPA: hypothetical protein GDO54_018178 [Pyxicephalus adspersus]